MAKRNYTPEEELWAMVDRLTGDPEAFLNLEDAEVWNDYMSERMNEFWGHEPSDAQFGFFGGASEQIRGALSAFNVSMERGATPAGVEYARFRDAATGRFVSFGSVREFLSGYFFGV